MILHRHQYGGAVFGRVAHDRHQNHADEHVGHAEDVGRMFHRPHQELAHDRHHHRGGDQNDERFFLAPGFDAQRFMGLLAAFADIEVFVRPQAEQQAQDVADEQHDGDFEAEFAFVRRRVARNQEVKDRRDNEADHAERQQGYPERGRSAVEILGLVFQAAGQDAGPEHQQDIADDRAGQRCLDHIDQASLQGNEPDDQFRRVAEGGVEQAADPRPEMLSQVLSGRAHQTGQGNDRQTRGDEDPDGIRMPQFQQDTQGYESQHSRQGCDFEVE